MLVLTSSWGLPPKQQFGIRLPGPDLTDKIVVVLLRFREEQIAVTGEIEAIYHQVKVPENQRCFLNFHQWRDSDSSKVVVDHEMTAHVFGGISSPFLSEYGPKKTAADNVKKYEEMCHLS